MRSPQFECREQGDGDNDWEPTEGDDAEEAAIAFGEAHELGRHSWQEMTVEVREIGLRDIETFELGIDWDPVIYIK